jgi:hypothetical protein
LYAAHAVAFGKAGARMVDGTPVKLSSEEQAGVIETDTRFMVGARDGR